MVESVNILVNSNGQIIRSDVVGALKMRTYLRYLISLFLSNQMYSGFITDRLTVSNSANLA